MNSSKAEPDQIWPYQTVGKEQNPPVLFLHGFMGAGKDWLPIANYLVSELYCILPDLPGHGHHTNLPTAQLFNFDIVIGGLLHLLDQLQLNSVSLVGYSMGGRIALYAATKYPARINALILESASPGLADEEERMVRTAQDDERAECLLKDGLDQFVEQWYDLPLFHSLHRIPHILDVVKQNRKQNQPAWMAKIITELSPGRQPPLWNHLSALSMPVMLMTGALDVKYSTLVLTMSRLIPDVITHIVPGAGHNVHLEQPKQSADLIKNFVTERINR